MLTTEDTENTERYEFKSHEKCLQQHSTADGLVLLERKPNPF